MKLGDFERNESADELAKKLNDLDGVSVPDNQAAEEVYATVRNASHFNSLIKERVDGEDMQPVSLWTSLRSTTSFGRSGAWASPRSVRLGARAEVDLFTCQRGPQWQVNRLEAGIWEGTT